MLKLRTPLLALSAIALLAGACSSGETAEPGSIATDTIAATTTTTTTIVTTTTTEATTNTSGDEDACGVPPGAHVLAVDESVPVGEKHQHGDYCYHPHADPASEQRSAADEQADKALFDALVDQHDGVKALLDDYAANPTSEPEARSERLVELTARVNELLATATECFAAAGCIAAFLDEEFDVKFEELQTAEEAWRVSCAEDNEC